jgi:hypothetical protein
VRPESFDTELNAEWGAWVLELGLPELPEVVACDESVPVAYWAAPLVGAVLYVQRSPNDDEDEDDEGDRVDTETVCFGRTSHGWEPGVGQGGSWPSDPRLTRLAVPGDHVEFSGGFETVGEDGWRCVAVDGVVSTQAAWIEVTDIEGTDRRRVEAPTGAVIVGFPSDNRPALIRVLDGGETEIGRHTAW